jgi:hypothetical protein
MIGLRCSLYATRVGEARRPQVSRVEPNSEQTHDIPATRMFTTEGARDKLARRYPEPTKES